MRRLVCVLLASVLASGCGGDEQSTQDTTRTDTGGDAADSGDSGGDVTGPETADTGEPETADTSEPDTADTGDVVPPANFACLGQDPAYPSGSGTVEYDVKLVDYVTKAPIANVRGRFCERFDPYCTAPVHEDSSDADGILHVRVPAGFDGLIIGDGGGIMTTVQVVDPPIVAAPAIVPQPLTLITPAQADLILTLFELTPDAEAGQVVATALDCDGKPAAGVQFEIGVPGATIGYLANGLPDPSATATDGSGTGGIFNVPPGFYLITAKTADGRVYGRARTPVGAGMITTVAVTPQQTTPDLTCGEVEPRPGVSGDFTVPYRLRAFSSGGPVVGAHLKVCAAADAACTTPLDEGDSDAAGDVAVTFAFPADGFVGFLEITGVGVFPTRLVYTLPLTLDATPTGPFYVEILAPDEIGIFATVAGAVIDPDLAQVAVAVVDCDRQSAHGMSVSALPSTDKTKVIYVGGGLPAPAASATDDSGLAGIFNVPAGEEVVVSATFGGTIVGGARFTPVKGFLHEITIFPSK